MGNSKSKKTSSKKKTTKKIAVAKENGSIKKDNISNDTTLDNKVTNEDTKSITEKEVITEKTESLESKKKNIITDEKSIDKKKLKKNIIVSFVVVVIVGILLVVYFNTLGSNSYRLKKLGYNETEANTIIEKTSRSNMQYLYKVGYTKNIPELVKLKDFKKSNFNKYVDYYNKYNKVTNEDLLVIVNKGADKYEYNEFLMSVLNSKDYKQNNCDKYMTYHKDNNKANYEDVVFLINSNINNPHSDMLVMIAKEKYFIYDRLERYINYAKNNDKLTSKEVVTNVNCDIDKKFYEEITNANVNKKELVLINKFYKLNQNYANNGDLVELEGNYSNRFGQKLSKETADAFKKLVDDAEKEGIHIRNNDAYRDYSLQEYDYNESAMKNGLTAADSLLARPGHSEHQTGFALDVNKQGQYDLDSFVYTNEYQWMINNAHKYGFILRYPKGKEYLTGYDFKPWHFRYVGEKAATEIKKRDITLEEYYAYFVIKK